MRMQQRPRGARALLLGLWAWLVVEVEEHGELAAVEVVADGGEGGVE